MLKLLILLLSSFHEVRMSFLHINLMGTLSPTLHGGKIWAVLAATSEGWDNYRHQADICHAYQVLHNNGVPDERIIVMMVDDIAYHKRNPTPGVIINRPHGPNVYRNVPKDYIGTKGVTSKNLRAVLRGDKEALKYMGSGKVVESGPLDNIFIYIVDHGGPGLITFPEADLTALELNTTINYMHTNHKYNKMVIYLEACHSGSMFDGVLPTTINVFASTAANPYESSYSIYFDDRRGTFLGDEYSIAWLEDSAKANMLTQTLQQQYEIVKMKTESSEVMKYGDLTMMDESYLGEFQGYSFNAFKKVANRKKYPPLRYTNPVRSGDVPIHAVLQRLEKVTDEKERQRLNQILANMIQNRKILDQTMTKFVELVSKAYGFADIWGKQLKLKDHLCYQEARKYFHEECFSIYKNTHVMEYMYLLVNFCELGVNPKTQQEAMIKVCIHDKMSGIV